MRTFALKIATASITICLVYSLPGLASDKCPTIVKHGPNVPRAQGNCELVGKSKDEAKKKPLDGLVRCKDDNGKVIEESIFKNGDLLSTWFYDFDRHKLSFHFNKQDKAHGPASAFGEDGTLLCEMQYVNGKPDGAAREYGPDGKLKGLRWFKNGRLEDAPLINYSKKGELSHLVCPGISATPEDKALCGFNGKPVTVKVYGGFDDTVTHINGRLAERVRYNRNEEKTWRTLYPDPGNKQTYHEEELYKNGKTRIRFSVVDGKKEGAYREYADTGTLILEKEFRNDVMVSGKSYYLNGKLQEQSVLAADGASVSIKEFWDDGKPKSVGTFVFKQRGSYGSIWTDTVTVGKHFKYAEDGTISEEANYDEDGNLDGTRILIDDKKKRTEAVYRKGMLASMKTFSADGKLTLSEEYHEDGSRK
jgi:antitoxin component YwqK of YwqJK toxin-antitoxin module